MRGYLTRQHYKKIQRAEFDQTVQHNSSVGQTPDGQTLALLIQKLLFFYSEEEDASRLVCLRKLLIVIFCSYMLLMFRCVLLC